MPDGVGSSCHKAGEKCHNSHDCCAGLYCASHKGGLTCAPFLPAAGRRLAGADSMPHGVGSSCHRPGEKCHTTHDCCGGLFCASHKGSLTCTPILDSARRRLAGAAATMPHGSRASCKGVFQPCSSSSECCSHMCVGKQCAPLP